MTLPLSSGDVTLRHPQRSATSDRSVERNGFTLVDTDLSVKSIASLVELPCGPVDPEHTLEAGELRRAFADFEILDYREEILFPEDVRKTRGMASLVARRFDRYRRGADVG